MKTTLVLPALVLAVLSGQAVADQRNTSVAGAIIGGAAGAAIGHHVGGRDGAVLGGAIGAATGVAVATSRPAPERRVADSDNGRDDYIYQDEPDEVVYERERVVYVEPEIRERVVYVQPRPVVVVRPAPVVYRPAPVIYSPVRQVVYYEGRGWDGHPGRGHGHYKRDRGYDRHGRDHYKEYYKHVRKHGRDDD